MYSALTAEEVLGHNLTTGLGFFFKITIKLTFYNVLAIWHSLGWLAEKKTLIFSDTYRK